MMREPHKILVVDDEPYLQQHSDPTVPLHRHQEVSFAEDAGCARSKHRAGNRELEVRFRQPAAAIELPCPCGSDRPASACLGADAMHGVICQERCAAPCIGCEEQGESHSPTLRG